MIRMSYTIKRLKFRMTGFGYLVDMVLITKMGNIREKRVLGKFLTKYFIQ